VGLRILIAAFMVFAMAACATTEKRDVSNFDQSFSSVLKKYRGGGYRTVAAECPSEGPEHKYLVTPIDFRNFSQGTFRLHYKLQNGFSKDKRTLLLLPGGPGQAGDAYDSCGESFCFSQLGEQFNIVTLDPRGTGCSLLPAAAEVEFTTILASAEDIEHLKKHLVGENGKISVFGASFGTALGMVYTSRHESSVDRLILEGPQADNQYANHTAFDRNFQLILDAHPEIAEDWKELKAKLDAGKLRITPGEFRHLVENVGYSYVQTIVWPKLIVQLNHGEYKGFDAVASAYKSTNKAIFESQAFKYIYCREELDFNIPEMIPPTEEGEFVTKVCAPFKERSLRARKYNSRDYATFKTATLMITGQWDGISCASYNANPMSRFVGNSRSYEIPFAGHGVIGERNACDVALVKAFLDFGLGTELQQVFESDVCQRQ